MILACLLYVEMFTAVATVVCWNHLIWECSSSSFGVICRLFVNFVHLSQKYGLSENRDSDTKINNFSVEELIYCINSKNFLDEMGENIYKINEFSTNQIWKVLYFTPTQPLRRNCSTIAKYFLIQLNVLKEDSCTKACSVLISRLKNLQTDPLKTTVVLF